MGARVSEVAKHLGISSSAAYSWVKEAAPAPSAPTFVRLVPAQASPAIEMVLEVGTVKLRVGDDFDAALLRRVVAALSGATSLVRGFRSTWRSSLSICGWATSVLAGSFASGCTSSREAKLCSSSWGSAVTR